MVFNDDEFIVPTPHDSGLTQETFIQGKTKLTITKKEKAPLEECNTTVFLQLTDTGFESERHGVDIVAVVNATEENLKKLKNAMHFMINKLSSSDRFSIITFAKNNTTRLCPLTQMTEISKVETMKVVHDIGACDGANIFASLEMAAQVLHGRRHAKGRVGAIMVMSDGNSQSEDLRDAAQFGLDHVPIYTFGFGDGCDHKVLKAIAEDTGGMFTNANVENTPSNNLGIMFSESLGRLLNEDVKNLELTIQELDSKIEKLNVGSYPRLDNNVARTTTIIFGNLYKQEIINLSIDILLPAVSIDNKGKNAVEFTLSYSIGENRLDTCRIQVGIIRSSQVVVHEDMGYEPFFPQEQVSDQTVSLNSNDHLTTEELAVTKKGETSDINNTNQSYFIPKIGGINKANLAKKIITPFNNYWKQFNSASNEPSEDDHEPEIVDVVDVFEKSESITRIDSNDSEGINDIAPEETKTNENNDASSESVNDVDHQITNKVNVIKEDMPVIKNIDSEMPTSMDLLSKHLKEAVDLINAMQDDLNKFL